MTTTAPNSVDVVLTAFSCSNAAPCNEWAKRWFKEPPKVVWVPGADSLQFENAGTSAGQDLVAWAAAHAQCLPSEVRRIAAVTFSAGWGFAYRLMRSPTVGALDTVLLLDGMHTHDLGGPKVFAECAAHGDPTNPTLIMAHSQIVPPFVPSKVTNTEIMGAAKACWPGGIAAVDAPDYVSHAALDAPVTCGNQYGKHTFTDDPLAAQENAGNCWRMEYAGNDAAIHIYIATVAQPRYWRWLAERWADPTAGVQPNRPAPAA